MYPKIRVTLPQTRECCFLIFVMVHTCCQLMKLLQYVDNTERPTSFTANWPVTVTETRMTVSDDGLTDARYHLSVFSHHKEHCTSFSATVND